MRRDFISKESHIISYNKLRDAFFGKQEVSDHVLIVPAERLEPRKSVDGGAYQHRTLEEYREQLVTKYHGNIPFSLISRGGVRIFRPNSRMHVSVEDEEFDIIANGWSFNDKYGANLGKHFIQVAHVYSHYKIGRIHNNEMSDFLLGSPLDSMESKRTERGTNYSNDYFCRSKGEDEDYNEILRDTHGRVRARRID